MLRYACESSISASLRILKANTTNKSNNNPVHSMIALTSTHHDHSLNYSRGIINNFSENDKRILLLELSLLKPLNAIRLVLYCLSKISTFTFSNDTFNKNIKVSSFTSSENIQNIEGGPDCTVSNNKLSSVTLN